MSKARPDDEEKMTHPMIGTEACNMLASAVNAAMPRLGSKRQISAHLGYRETASFNQLTTGSATIPVDRVPQFIACFGLDPKTFLFAVLEQRYPSVPFRNLLTGTVLRRGIPTSPIRDRSQLDLEGNVHRDTHATILFDDALAQKVALLGSNRKVAEAFGGAFSQINHWASGRYKIPIHRVEEVCRFFGLDHGSFLLAVLYQHFPYVPFSALLL